MGHKATDTNLEASADFCRARLIQHDVGMFPEAAVTVHVMIRRFRVWYKRIPLDGRYSKCLPFEPASLLLSAQLDKLHSLVLPRSRYTLHSCNG